MEILLTYCGASRRPVLLSRMSKVRGVADEVRCEVRETGEVKIRQGLEAS